MYYYALLCLLFYIPLYWGSITSLSLLGLTVDFCYDMVGVIKGKV